MIIDSFKRELTEHSSSFICSKWLFERIPFVFSDDRLAYIKWIEALAERLEVDSKSMIFIGSSSCGFSLNPNKSFKTFDESSDVDIAIVSQYYFDVSWKTLRDLGTKRLVLTRIQKASLEDHVTRLVYWGTIATDKLLEILPFGKAWLLHMSEIAQSSPINGKTINIRLYKDYDSLRAYQIQNLEKLKLQLYNQ